MQLRMDSSWRLHLAAPLCSCYWPTLHCLRVDHYRDLNPEQRSRGSTKRSRHRPQGDEEKYPSVHRANIFAERLAHVCLVAHSLGVYFAIEQPASSDSGPHCILQLRCLHAIGREDICISSDRGALASAVYAEDASLHESPASVICYVHIRSPDCEANRVPWIATELRSMIIDVVPGLFI